MRLTFCPCSKFDNTAGDVSIFPFSYISCWRCRIVLLKIPSSVYIEACQYFSHRCTQTHSLVKTLSLLLRSGKIRQEFLPYSVLLMIFIWYRACNLLKHKHTHKKCAQQTVFLLYFLEPFVFNLACNCLWGKSFHFVVKRQTFSQSHTELQNNSNVFVAKKIKTHYSIDIFY